MQSDDFTKLGTHPPHDPKRSKFFNDAFAARPTVYVHVLYAENFYHYTLVSWMENSMQNLHDGNFLVPLRY